MELVECKPGQRFLAGARGQPLITRADDISMVLEACYSHGVDRILLYPEHLPARFFDLSSGEAGAVLQKLRNYHLRLGVVLEPDTQISHRFAELMVDEQRGSDFRLFSDPALAHAWLCEP